MKKSRQRGKNFSHAEEMLLVELVEAAKDTLENKKSDAVTWKQKEESWEKLANQFVSQSGIQRTPKTLKEKYDNLKRKTKVEVAMEKRETYRTGGGPPATGISDVSEKIISLVGESATGLVNMFDSDHSDSILRSTAATTEAEIDETFLAVRSDDPQVLEEEDDNEPAATTNSFQKWNPAKLREKKSTKLAVNKSNKRICTLEAEKICLTKLQQDFYRNENIRAEEKYQSENKRAEERHIEEQKSLRLKNELIELEVLEKKQKLGLV